MAQRTFASPDNAVVQNVSQELRRDYKKNFVRGGTVCFERFPAFTVRYPTIDASQYPTGFVEFVAGGLTDRYAKETLEKDFRCLNWLRECTHLIPLYTTGDGNCLLHAASLAMWGFEDKQFILRNALYESLTTADRNNNTLQDRCRMSVSSMLRDVQVNVSDNDWFLEWQQIVNQARPNSNGHQQSLEESHIFVLANILRRPIIIYGVPKVRSFNTGGTMQNINFHGIYLPLLWGSQLCHKPPLCLGYGVGHFTALVPAGNPQQQLVVPLTDNNGHVLPIRFLLQAEEHNTLYLLEQYLDVIQVFPSLLGKQIPVAVIALREAAHMQQLVQMYIDKSLTAFTQQNQPYYAQNQPTGTPQGEVQRQPCVGCQTGAYGSAETNFLCSVCYKRQISAAVDYNSGAEQLQWNDFNTGKSVNQRVSDVQNPPAPRPTGEPGEREKCRQCNDFFANEEYGGLCSGCFKKLTIVESQQKPPPPAQQPQHVQPNPVQAINNTEPVAEMCRVCKDFHGDAQFGGLCSVCFKKKSKEESTAKPPQQPLNDFKQPAKQPSYQPQQPLPVQQQGRTNPPPVGGSQPQPTLFGFTQCINHGCVRAADEQSQGYCTQCFYSNVVRYQQSQPHQQRPMGQQQDQQWQQQQNQKWQQDEQARIQQQAEKEHMEQERIRQQQVEKERIEQERIKQQQAEKERMEQERIRQQEERLEQEHVKEQERIKQEEMAKQAMMNTTQRSDFVPQAQQHQFQQPKPQETSPAPHQPRHAMTGPVPGSLCNNINCSDFAAVNCNGYCSKCYSEYSQPANATATTAAAASQNHSPTINSGQRPQIKPRRNVPSSKTEVISTKSVDESVETLSVGRRSNSAAAATTAEVKCFVCAKRKPDTGDALYSLCPTHAQQVMSSLILGPLPESSQQPETSYTAQQSNYGVHDTAGDQQRRGSADYVQPMGSVRHSAEQRMTQYSGEQYQTERTMTNYSGEQYQTGRAAGHYSGEQLNRSPHMSGPQPNLFNHPPQQHQTNIPSRHTEEHYNRAQHNHPQEPQSRTTELPFGGPPSNYPPNSKNYNKPFTSGQHSYQQNNPSLPMGGQAGPQDDHNQRISNSYQSNMMNHSGTQGDINSRTVEYQPTHFGQQSVQQPGQYPNYGDQQIRKGDISNSNDIRYPPNLNASMGYSDQHHYNALRDDLQHSGNQFNSQQPNQFGGGRGGYPSAHNDQQNYQQQWYQQQQHPGGGAGYHGPPKQQHQQYAHQQQGGNQGYGEAGNYGAAGGGYGGAGGGHGGAGAAANYPPQAGGYRDNPGGYRDNLSSYRENPGGQTFPSHKPPINSHADPNATHPHNDDMPRAKVLCKYPGCSFYADPKLENYCQDCYDNKTGMKNYKRCENPTCPNHVPVSSVQKYCDSCLVSSAK